VRCLVNNAGLIGPSAVRVNHLGHMALTLGLLEPLIRAGGTVVNVASVAHTTQGQGLGKRLSETLSGKRGLHDTWAEYADSKAANVLFTSALARQLDPVGVRAVSYHPGIMLSDLWRNPNQHPTTATTEGRTTATTEDHATSTLTTTVHATTNATAAASASSASASSASASSASASSASASSASASNATSNGGGAIDMMRLLRVCLSPCVKVSRLGSPCVKVSRLGSPCVKVSRLGSEPCIH
jgi:NAD(P)-dependent dehydrogenase (short-subunit alcohol dehydrogenase family)